MIEIVAAGDTLRIACGALRTRAEPLGKRDALWVELEPGEGSALRFESDGATPDALIFEDQRYSRVS